MNSQLLPYIISPILVTLGGIIAWLIKAKRDEVYLQEEKAREKKIEVYEELLGPFIAAFTSTISDEYRTELIEKIKTLEYKRAAFNLTTFGSDNVVRSFNKIMQSFYSRKLEDFASKEDYAAYFLKDFSDLLLNIRKDLYSKKTRLSRSNMIEFMITDIEKYRKRLD